MDPFDGGTVETREYPHDDHFALPASCAHEAREWLTRQLPSCAATHPASLRT
jgi:hypothetical protein